MKISINDFFQTYPAEQKPNNPTRKTNEVAMNILFAAIEFGIAVSLFVLFSDRNIRAIFPAQDLRFLKPIFAVVVITTALIINTLIQKIAQFSIQSDLKNTALNATQKAHRVVNKILLATDLGFAIAFTLFVRAVKNIAPVKNPTISFRGHFPIPLGTTVLVILALALFAFQKKELGWAKRNIGGDQESIRALQKDVKEGLDAGLQGEMQSRLDQGYTKFDHYITQEVKKATAAKKAEKKSDEV